MLGPVTGLRDLPEMTPGSKSASVPTAIAHWALTAGPEQGNPMLLYRQEM